MSESAQQAQWLLNALERIERQQETTNEILQKLLDLVQINAPRKL